jgi:hypothetical protein
MTAVLHLVPDDLDPPGGADPRDPVLYRQGLASARAALRGGRRRPGRPAPDAAARPDGRSDSLEDQRGDDRRGDDRQARTGEGGDER